MITHRWAHFEPPVRLYTTTRVALVYPEAIYGVNESFDKCKQMSYIVRMKPPLVWDEWNKKHIHKHGVTIKEAEVVYAHQECVFIAKSGRTGIMSRLPTGRLVTIFLSFAKQKCPYVVSARDASKKERKFYHEKDQIH